jgi:hypothetical protein
VQHNPPKKIRHRRARNPPPKNRPKITPKNCPPESKNFEIKKPGDTAQKKNLWKSLTRSKKSGQNSHTATPPKTKDEKMPMYLVTKTETVTVHAWDEEEAVSKANDEFNELPDATYQVVQVTPQHRLREIEAELRRQGVAVYYDDFRNNVHDFLRVSLKAMHPDDADMLDVYFLQCALDENEEFNGLQYELFNVDYNELGSYPATLSPEIIATLARKSMARHEATVKGGN